MTELSHPRALRDSDEVNDFDCGFDGINEWVAKYAHKAADRGTAVVYVAVSDKTVRGFYSLSSYSMMRDEIKSG
ncbi:MAG: hypothetical protein LKI93_01510 [Bifidobacteriaceae bacterium]|jgi:hypothetical protein|nr:hypothetical protein [Bifidobacteriaceae bacterium]